MFLWSQQCASKVSGGGFSSSKEFPDEVLRFVRSHPVMYRPVLPQHHRPVLLQTEPGGRKLTQIAVDRVQAQDGHYHVLYIGTGKHGSTKHLVPQSQLPLRVGTGKTSTEHRWPAQNVRTADGSVNP